MLSRFIMCIALAMFANGARAEYPDRPVKVVNPFSVGGSGDITQRLFAQKLSEQTGKPFFVDNKTGASGRIGYDSVAKSPPDGYTLVAGDATYTILPGLYRKLPWDPATDLVPVTIYSRTPFVLVVNPQSSFKSLKELLAYAKSHPDELNFGSAGVGSINHLVMEVVAHEAGVKMTHIPFRGMGDALNALMSNSIDVIATGVPTAISHIKSGKAIPLALTAQTRWPATPEVPTLSEEGLNFVTYSWFGILAPKGTPKPAVDYLRNAVVELLKDPSMKERLDQQGLEGSGISPEQFGEMLRTDIKRWTELIEAANISPE